MTVFNICVLNLSNILNNVLAYLEDLIKIINEWILVGAKISFSKKIAADKRIVLHPRFALGRDNYSIVPPLPAGWCRYILSDYKSEGINRI